MPTAITPEEREAHFALTRQLFGELAHERLELPNGYAYRFQPDVLETVARFVANEKRCCPFLNFEVTVALGSGPLWVHITGPAGTRAILEAELTISSAIATQRS